MKRVLKWVGLVAVVLVIAAGAISAILAALGRRGLAASSVSAISLTHGHGDHVAGCRLFPDAKIYALATFAGTH